jgi:hypothetical protein
LGLQTAQPLPVLAIDHTWAPDGPAAYGDEGSSWSAYNKNARRFGSVLRTEATPGEAVK